MGADIHIKIAKRNQNNIWEPVRIYRKINDKFELIKVYPFRNYELFDILNGNEDEKYHAYPISLNILSEDLKNEIEKDKNEFGFYGFKEINLSDLKIYLHHNPKVRDWDYNDENNPKAWKDNPVKYFIETIENYIDFADPDWILFTPFSDIKIIYYFDN